LSDDFRSGLYGTLKYCALKALGSAFKHVPANEPGMQMILRARSIYKN
jgi:hypothetical protein